MKARKVPAEIALFAIGREGNKPTIIDAVETSHHFAPHFARRFLRDPEVHAIGACKPGTLPDATQVWELRRG